MVRQETLLSSHKDQQLVTHEQSDLEELRNLNYTVGKEKQTHDNNFIKK